MEKRLGRESAEWGSVRNKIRRQEVKDELL